MKRSFSDRISGFVGVLVILGVILLIVSGVKNAIEDKASRELRQPVVDAKIAAIEKSLDQTNFKVTVYSSEDGGETFFLSFVAYRDGPMYDAKLKWWSCCDFGWLMSRSEPNVYIDSEDEISLNDWTFSNVGAYNSFPDFARGFLMESKWVPLTIDSVEKYESKAQYISVEGSTYKKYHWYDNGRAISLVDEFVNDEGMLLEYYSRSYSYDGKRSEGKNIDHVIVSELGEVSISDELPTYGTILGTKWKGKYVWDSTPGTKEDWQWGYNPK